MVSDTRLYEILTFNYPSYKSGDKTSPLYLYWRHRADSDKADPGGKVAYAKNIGRTMEWYASEVARLKLSPSAQHTVKSVSVPKESTAEKIALGAGLVTKNDLTATPVSKVKMPEKMEEFNSSAKEWVRKNGGYLFVSIALLIVFTLFRRGR